MAKKLYTISAYTENTPGVLHRLTVSFTRRKINVESLSVCETHRKGISIFTITAYVDDTIIGTLVKQIKRIIEVKEVFASEDHHLVLTEVAFVKISSKTAEEKLKIEKLAFTNGARVVFDENDSVVIEIKGVSSEIDAVYDLFKAFEILDFVRSGRIAMRKLASVGVAEDEVTA